MLVSGDFYNIICCGWQRPVYLPVDEFVNRWVNYEQDAHRLNVFRWITIDKMSVDEISTDNMSVNEMSVMRYLQTICL